MARARRIVRTQQEISDRIKSLKKILRKGSTFYTLAMGWSRQTGGASSITCLAIHKGKIVNIGAAVSDILDLGWYDNGAVAASWPNTVARRLADTLYGAEDALNHQIL